MTDQTEDIRKQMVVEINAQPGSREYLEAKHGQVWDTTQLSEGLRGHRVHGYPSWSFGVGSLTGRRGASTSSITPVLFRLGRAPSMTPASGVGEDTSPNVLTVQRVGLLRNGYMSVFTKNV